LYGDLDGDGTEDALVFLIERGGGTAAFTYVGAQLNRDGQPVDAGAALVEDRTQILSASIENGQVELEITTYGPGDGACCPSYRASRTYALQDGQLVEVAGEDQELVRISVADLDGTTWTLLEINKDQPALADTEVTISFQDGQISGSGGCNSYNGSFSLSEDNPFLITIGPLASTQMACPEPILNQETAYLIALERVSRWGYAYGRLALAYTDDQGNNVVLLFAPQAAAEMGPADDTLTDVPASSEPLSAEIANVEGGTTVVTGEVTSDNYAFMPDLWPNPTQAPGDTILVLTVGENTLAADAGWLPGTEIVSIAGEPIADKYEALPLSVSTGVEEVQRSF
jgi:heat shock protein HslJ